MVENCALDAWLDDYDRLQKAVACSRLELQNSNVPVAWRKIKARSALKNFEEQFAKLEERRKILGDANLERRLHERKF